MKRKKQFILVYLIRVFDDYGKFLGYSRYIYNNKKDALKYIKQCGYTCELISHHMPVMPNIHELI